MSELRRLIRRRGPSDSVVVLEGPRTVAEALAASVEPSLVAVPQGARSDRTVQAVLRALSPGVEVLVVADEAFDSLAPARSPQPLLALVPRPRAHMPGSLVRDDLVLVLVDVADPGNMGTIIRSASACAARCVIVVGGADPWAPKAVRASAGSVLRVPVVSEGDAAEVLAALRAAGARILVADAHQGVPHDSGALAAGSDPVALVLGAESHGLDPGLRELADLRVRVPMADGTESLNVAMAATLLAFEYRR